MSVGLKADLDGSRGYLEVNGQPVIEVRSDGSAWLQSGQIATGSGGGGDGGGDVTGPNGAVSNQLALFADATGKLLKSGVQQDSLAPKISPALTGTPTAPTAAPGTNTGQIATTAFVIANASASGGNVTGPANSVDSQLALFSGTTGKVIKSGVQASTLAPLASPAFSGTPTAPTQAVGNNSTRLATTAFVTNAIGGAAGTGNVIGPANSVDHQMALFSGTSGKVIKAVDIVGEVSESLGFPTGSVMEAGSNENGRYLRFADGTQVCWQTVDLVTSTSVPVGSLHRGVDSEWIFPAEFVLATYCFTASVGLTFSVTNVAWVTYKAISETGVIFVGVAALPVSEEQAAINLMIIGRWFVQEEVIP